MLTLTTKEIHVGGLVHRHIEHLIAVLIQAPHVVEQSQRFAALRYQKDPAHATLFSEAIAY